MAQVVILSSTLGSMMGVKPLLQCYGYFFIAGSWTRYVSPSFATMTEDVQQAEGTLLDGHTRLHSYAEEVTTPTPHTALPHASHSCPTPHTLRCSTPRTVALRLTRRCPTPHTARRTLHTALPHASHSAAARLTQRCRMPRTALPHASHSAAPRFT